MLKSLSIAGALALATALAPAARADDARAAVERNVDGALDRALREQRIVGAVVVVSRNGKVLYRKAKGLADREAKRPMREDAVFRFSSVTKPIVSVAALRLVDQRVLSLADPVTRWLPDFKPKLADGTTPVITVQHLLTHTSGLGYGFFEPADGPYHKLGVSDGLDSSGITLDENLRRLARAPLLHAPGTAFAYGLSTDVLGRIIEKATKRDLAAAVRALVTEPLRMADTEFVASHPERLATPYADGKPAPVRMAALAKTPFAVSAIDFSPGRALDRRAYFSGGGGMVGTADDLVRFLETIRTGGAPLLTAATAAKIGAPAIGALPTLGGPGWSWGLLSLVLVDQKLANTPQHAGTMQWGGVYGNTWWVDPRAGLTVVILTNTAFEGMSGKLPDEIKRGVYDALR